MPIGGGRPLAPQRQTDDKYNNYYNNGKHGLGEFPSHRCIKSMLAYPAIVGVAIGITRTVTAHNKSDIDLSKDHYKTEFRAMGFL